jgi:hypothetical protein
MIMSSNDPTYSESRKQHNACRQQLSSWPQDEEKENDDAAQAEPSLPRQAKRQGEKKRQDKAGLILLGNTAGQKTTGEKTPILGEPSIA